MENENRKRKKMLAKVDTLNDFPDEILTYILSLLPCKDAFRTAVLSKRWISLCHSRSSLDINDEGVKNSEDWIYFRQFMDKVMFSPQVQRLTLKTLSLRCLSEHWKDEANGCLSFDNWLEAAKQRGVWGLNLLLSNVPFAPTIFCCKTLVHLNLMTISVGSMLHCSVDLPLLKTLNMLSVGFEDMKDFVKLLLGCPKLKSVNIHGVYANVTIVENLTKLIMDHLSLLNIPIRVVYEANYLSVYNDAFLL